MVAPMIKTIIVLLNFAFKWWKDVNMLITNMIWKELSHTNSLIMITRWSYLWVLYKSAEYQLVQTVSRI